METNYKLVQESKDTNYRRSSVGPVKVGESLLIKCLDWDKIDLNSPEFQGYPKRIFNAEIIEIHDLGEYHPKKFPNWIMRDYEFIVKCDEDLGLEKYLNLENCYVLHSSILTDYRDETGALTFELLEQY